MALIILGSPGILTHYKFSMQKFEALDENVDAVVPDIAVDLTFEDYRNGIDPVLKAALDYPIE